MADKDNAITQELIDKAESGDGQAQLELGRLYLQNKDRDNAKKWLDKAIENGVINAYFWLGEIYNVEGNYCEAKNCYKIVISHYEDRYPSGLDNEYYYHSIVNYAWNSWLDITEECDYKEIIKYLLKAQDDYYSIFKYSNDIQDIAYLFYDLYNANHLGWTPEKTYEYFNERKDRSAYYKFIVADCLMKGQPSWNYEKAKQYFTEAANDEPKLNYAKIKIEGQLAANGQYESDEEIVKKLKYHLEGIKQHLKDSFETVKGHNSVKENNSTIDRLDVNIKLLHGAAPTVKYEGSTRAINVVKEYNGLIEELRKIGEDYNYPFAETEKDALEYLNNLKHRLSDGGFPTAKRKLAEVLKKIYGRCVSSTILGEYISSTNTVVLYVTEIKRVANSRQASDYAQELLRVFAHEVFHAFHCKFAQKSGWGGGIKLKAFEVPAETLARGFEYSYCKEYLKNEEIAKGLIEEIEYHDMDVYPYSGAKYLINYYFKRDLFVNLFEYSLLDWEKVYECLRAIRTVTEELFINV